MILIDIGYKHNGYCADMTRCYNITNHAKKNLYTFVMNIQNYVKRIVRAGMTFQDVEDAYLDVSNYGIMATIVGRGKWGK